MAQERPSAPGWLKHLRLGVGASAARAGRENQFTSGSCSGRRWTTTFLRLLGPDSPWVFLDFSRVTDRSIGSVVSRTGKISQSP